MFGVLTLMTNTMKQSNLPKKLIRTGWIVLAIILSLLFFCVYFDTTSSTYMVNSGMNKFLIPVFTLCALYTFALYRADKILPKRTSFIMAASSILACLGFAFIAGFLQQTASSFILYGMLVIAGIWLYLKCNKKLNWKISAYLIIACGCVMIIGYGMAVPETLDLHDSFFYNSFEESYGHANYIGHIFNNWALPDTNAPWQFYQPPLHHIIAAVFCKINELLGVSYRQIAENVAFLTGLYSCLNVVVWYIILRELKLQKAALLIPLAIIALHPTAFIMGNCTSNDMLMWLFTSLCVLYMIKWYNSPSMKNIAIMALCLGLGMMSKLSTVMLAPAIAVMLVIKLLQSGKFEKFLSLIKQYAVFGVISIPLGMWYSIRNRIKFGQPLGFVPEITSESQYIGNYSILERIIPFNFDTLTASPYVIWNQGGEYNLFIKLLKTSLFGETSYAEDYGNTLPYLLTFLNYFLVILSVVAIVYVLYKLKKTCSQNMPYYILGIVYIIMIIMMVYFLVSHPHQCTIDMRYIYVNIPIGALFIGKMCSLLQAEVNADRGSEQSAFQLIKSSVQDYISVIVIFFCLFSATIFYLDSVSRVF